jgi:6-phosphogluconolactonase
MVTPEIQVVPDPQSVAQAAADRIIAAADQAIALQDTFSLVLSGGSTPKVLYTILAATPARDQIDWTKVTIFFGDERCVPPDDEQSNYRMARETLLSKVPIPGDNVYRIHGESDPHQAAIEYGQALKDMFGESGPDLTLLGMGDDGHTASLFPHTEALKETKHRCIANFVPKLNTWRVTMSAPFLNKSRQVLILVNGQGKAARIAEVLEGPPLPDDLPIQRIAPASGRLVWIMDAAAAGM